jgi:hypothetical protein
METFLKKGWKEFVDLWPVSVLIEFFAIALLSKIILGH